MKSNFLFFQFIVDEYFNNGNRIGNFNNISIKNINGIETFIILYDTSRNNNNFFNHKKLSNCLILSETEDTVSMHIGLFDMYNDNIYYSYNDCLYVKILIDNNNRQQIIDNFKHRIFDISSKDKYELVYNNMLRNRIYTALKKEIDIEKVVNMVIDLLNDTGKDIFLDIKKIFTNLAKKYKILQQYEALLKISSAFNRNKTREEIINKLNEYVLQFKDITVDGFVSENNVVNVYITDFFENVLEQIRQLNTTIENKSFLCNYILNKIEN